MTVAIRRGKERIVEPYGDDRERQLARLIRGKRDNERCGENEEKRSSWRGYMGMLRKVGLRPTRQRMMLASILFSRGDRHITAEMVYAEAHAARMVVSLATIYNTLHQFTDAGLLREIPVESAKGIFDTNPTAHHHFFVEDDRMVMDIPQTDAVLARLPEPPAGFEIARVDVTVRLRRKTN